MTRRGRAIEEFPHSVVLSPIALPPRLLMGWMQEMRGGGELGEVDTIAVPDYLQVMERRGPFQDGRMKALMLKWYGECLLLHKCQVIDLILPMDMTGVSCAFLGDLRKTYAAYMPSGSPALTIREHNLLVERSVPAITKIVLLCVDPRLQDLAGGLIADMDGTRLFRIPGPDDTLAGKTRYTISDRKLVVQILLKFMTENDCLEAEVCIAGHDGCGKRNYSNGGLLTKQEDRELMVSDTEESSSFLRSMGFNVALSALNETGARFVVQAPSGKFEVATVHT